MNGVDEGRPLPCRVALCGRIKVQDFGIPVCAFHLGALDPEVRRRLRHAIDGVRWCSAGTRVGALRRLAAARTEALHSLDYSPVGSLVLKPAPWLKAGESFKITGPRCSRMRLRLCARCLGSGTVPAGDNDDRPCPQCSAVPDVFNVRRIPDAELFEVFFPEEGWLRALPESEQSSAPAEICDGNALLCCFDRESRYYTTCWPGWARDPIEQPRPVCRVCLDSTWCETCDDGWCPGPMRPRCHRGPS